jgi:GNAT superfamily N-acetyltransferase
MATRRARDARTDTPLRVHAATPARWPDVERLFGPRGACAGCWCMYPLLARKDYESGKGETNRRRLRRRVEAGEAPGVIGYSGGEPVGWCAVGPRAGYERLKGSRVLAPVDDAQVWSIPCLFVARSHRGRGLSRQLIDGAVKHARRNGASTIEAYPVELHGRAPSAFAWWGTVRTFEAAGFRVVARRSAVQPVMRKG